MREIKLNDFACSCGDDNKHECAEVRQWALEFLSSDNYRVTEAALIDGIVYYLSGYYRAQIVGIPNDPGGWSAVEAQSQDEGEDNKGIETFIQCDQILDGFAFTLKAFHDHYGPKRPYKEDSDEGED
jgi:hypothetical protein